jgi:hypothetical protein
MAMIEDASLVPYDPGWSVERYRTPRPAQTLAKRTSSLHRRHERTETCSLTGKPLRPCDPHSVYSFRQTIEASRTATTGLVVDIFV